HRRGDGPEPAPRGRGEHLVDQSPDNRARGVSQRGVEGGIGRLHAPGGTRLGASVVRVNAVLQGWVLTPMVEPYPSELNYSPYTVGCNMLRRLGEPEHIAGAVAFLL